MKKSIILSLTAIFISFYALAQHRSITWKQFKNSNPGLKQVGWISTKHAKDVESSSWWSIGCETLDRDYANFNIYKDYVGELGIKHARIQSGWAKTEKEKGEYNFAWLDTIVYELIKQKIEPWVCLCYGNPLYGTEIGLSTGFVADEPTISAWLNYVEATVKHYKDDIKEWEVWNEPRHEPRGAYANLLMKTAETIKKVQPDAVILGFSLSGRHCRIPLNFAKDIFDTLKYNNKLALIDYLTYHPYSRNPDDSYATVDKLREMAYSYNPDIKLFQGENGCPSILEWGHALQNYPWTEISQAKWVMRRMAGDRTRNIRSSVFTFIDLKYPNMLQSFGLIRSNLLNHIIYKRPSFYGVQHMAGFFDDKVESEGMLENSSNAYRNLTVAGFKKEGTPVVLIWYNDRIPDDKFEWDIVNLTVKDRNYKDPVYVEMISGKVFEIDKPDWENEGEDVVFKKLPVWDSVMMIAERSKVELGERPE